MEYRVLGRTGVKVSAIGIGGEGFENKSYEDCEAVASVMVGVFNTDQVLAATAYTTVSNGEKDYSEVLAKAPRSSFSDIACIVGTVLHVQEGLILHQ